MRIEKCWLCSCNIYAGHGITFVRNDAKMFRFCRSKCHKHFKAKHNVRKIPWTKIHRVLAGKELTKDSAFEFEKRRNVPVRYDRELYMKVVSGMKKVMQIQYDRRTRFRRERLAKIRGLHTRIGKERLQNHKSLVFGFEPDVLLKDRNAEMDTQQGEESNAAVSKVSDALEIAGASDKLRSKLMAMKDVEEQHVEADVDMEAAAVQRTQTRKKKSKVKALA
eukprot:Lankesteria_metandrocarpae@DN2635_c0_g2_i2.p1